MTILFVLFLMVGTAALAGSDAGNETECLVSEKADYKDLKDQFYEYEDDYLYYKSKYRNALLDSENKELSKYKYKLEDLDDDLKDLRENIRDLIYDVEDAQSCSGKGDLLDDLDDLKEDTSSLREKIADLLAEELKLNAEPASAYVPAKAELKAGPTVAPAKTEIVVSALNVGPKAPASVGVAAVTAPVAEKTASGWESMRQTAWLTAGIVILLAVVLFLLGLLFK